MSAIPDITHYAVDARAVLVRNGSGPARRKRHASPPARRVNHRCGEPRWRSSRRVRRAGVPDGLWDWLVDSASLTRRLRHAYPETALSIRVLGQRWARPLPSERRALAMRMDEFALIREVHIDCGAEPLVFARTVIPVRSVRGKARRLAYLGDKPLGSALFADRSMYRGTLEIAKVLPGQCLCYEGAAGIAAAIWGRRSLFWLCGKPLLVTEIFLPAHVRRVP